MLGTLMCLPVAAQVNALWRDAFTAGVNYSFNVRSIKDLDYNGVAVGGGYRKFLYWGLFVMPEVSLYWQKYDWSQLVSYDAAANSQSSYEPFYLDNALNRFGVAADVLVGVRIPIKDKVGIDLMAGPYIGWSFANNEDSGFSNYSSYDDFEVRCRFSAGVSILDKFTVTVSYDAGKTKFIDIPIGAENRGNIMSVGVGYTF